MSTLAEYLAEKGRALADRLARIARGEAQPLKLHALVSAEGRSGVRRIRIRDHQVLSDSARDSAGFDLGPSSPELQLGVLGSCLTHIVLIQAAERQIPIEEVEVEVSAVIDPRAGRPGFENAPVEPQDIECRVRIVADIERDAAQVLLDEVERTCPILNLLRRPQPVRTVLEHRRPGSLEALQAHALAT